MHGAQNSGARFDTTRHGALRLQMQCFVDDAVRAFAELLQSLIRLIAASDQARLALVTLRHRSAKVLGKEEGQDCVECRGE